MKNIFFNLVFQTLQYTVGCLWNFYYPEFKEMLRQIKEEKEKK